jgi:hypothetical protein
MQIESASGDRKRHNFSFHSDVKKADRTYSLPVSFTNGTGNDLANTLILSLNSLLFNTASHFINTLVCFVTVSFETVNF